MAAGGITRNIAARCKTGSGLVLDSEQIFRPEAEKILVLQCVPCGKLNEEDSKFCQECGKPM